MKKNILKIIGIVIVFAGVILPTIYAIRGTISESLFFLIFLAFILAGFLIYKIDEIVEFEIKGIKLKALQKEIFAKAEEVQKLSQELEQDKNNLKGAVKVFIETFYLSQSTRGRFPVPEGINKTIENNLNILSRFAIENDQERQKWIDSTTAFLNSNLKK